ncbi:MAG: hypothetical protein IKR58_01805 [Lachnospiraceae bacterium]|nr:hypothetical protein [Lachnospiraceae bacterium]
MKQENTNQPSCVLLCGNTEVLGTEQIERILQFYKVVLLQKGEAVDIAPKKYAGRLHIYKEETIEGGFDRLLSAHSPDAVWFFSGYLDDGKGLTDEAKKIETMVRSCGLHEISKLVAVFSWESQVYEPGVNPENPNERKYVDTKAFCCAQAEALLQFCSQKENLRTILLRVPFLSGNPAFAGRVTGYFDHVLKDEPIAFHFKETQPVDFISIRDLTELLVAVTEETMDESGTYAVYSGYEHAMRDLGGSLKKCRPTLEVTYDETRYYERTWDPKLQAERVRKNYGFIATDDVIADLEEDYRRYKDFVQPKETVKDRARAVWNKFSSNTVKVIELVLLFLLVQVLLGYTTDSVYFRYVDLRLFFILIFGTTYGMGYGIVAGVMECISLLYDYTHSGVTSTMLFYNMDYWLPFAIYIMTGSITGYISNNLSKKLEFAQEEVNTLQEKYLFLNDVYQSVVDNKDEYKKQILGYQDSFGKIFDAVEKLNSNAPADIFRNGIYTLENILDNHSIAIYTLDDNQAYGRLVACSGEMNQRLGKSLKIGIYHEVYETILSGATWKNTELDPGYPMYAYGILSGEKVRLMICIYEAGVGQMELYYLNLFTILCNLIQVSFLRALEYQEAIEGEKYYEGTTILMPEYFDQELQSRRKMADAGVASYVLLQIYTDDFPATCEKLQGMIRHSDELGDDQEGNHYLMLSQITGEIFKIIGNRLEAGGVEYRIVEGI